MISSILRPCVFGDTLTPSNHRMCHREHPTTPEITGLWYEDGCFGGVHFINMLIKKANSFCCVCLLMPIFSTRPVV